MAPLPLLQGYIKHKDMKQKLYGHYRNISNTKPVNKRVRMESPS